MQGEIRKLLQLSSNFLTSEWAFIDTRRVHFLVTFLVRSSTVLVHMNHADVLRNIALGGMNILWFNSSDLIKRLRKLSLAVM